MSTARPPRYRSKTLATWLAIALGALGAHRFYLGGWRDPWGWLYPLPTALGLLGVQRVRWLGQDDRLAWVLLPLLGVPIAAAMASAIAYGLTPDEKWDSRHNPAHPGRSTRWGPVLGVVLAVMVGAGVLMSTIAYGTQRFFEWQIERERRVAATARSEPPAAHADRPADRSADGRVGHLAPCPAALATSAHGRQPAPPPADQGPRTATG